MERRHVLTRPLEPRSARRLHQERRPTRASRAATTSAPQLSTSQYLLFLNNDTLVQPGWLEAMVGRRRGRRARRHRRHQAALSRIPTRIHHTGIIFTRRSAAAAHLSARRRVAAARQQAAGVSGGDGLLPADPARAVRRCGMFDEGYVNGYEDIDLCLTVRDEGRSVVCCTSAFIYHYGQITDTRTADDDANAARFMARMGRPDQPGRARLLPQDRRTSRPRGSADTRPVAGAAVRPRLVYFADDLSSAERPHLGHERAGPGPSPTAAYRSRSSKMHAAAVRPSPSKRRELETLDAGRAAVGGIQIRWSHYWPQHLGLELTGSAQSRAVRHQLPVRAARVAAVGLLAAVPRSESLSASCR